MKKTKDKRIVSDKNDVSLNLYRACADLSIVCFVAKRHESWTYLVFLLLGFGLPFGHQNKNSETHSDLKNITPEMSKRT